MPRRSVFSVTSSALSRAYQRNLRALAKVTLRNGKRLTGQVTRVAAKQLKPPPGPGDWLAGMALGPAGVRRFHLYRPPPPAIGGPASDPGRRRMPLLVMLHGCGQTGRDFAASTRMNRLAAREGFMVLYPDQDRLANAQGCWNWYDARSGKAAAEAATLMAAIDQASLLYPVDRERVAVAGLSAGHGGVAGLALPDPFQGRRHALRRGARCGPVGRVGTRCHAWQACTGHACSQRCRIGCSCGGRGLRVAVPDGDPWHGRCRGVGTQRQCRRRSLGPGQRR